MSVAKSSFIFAAGTFISRISGVLRESVAGAVFGASVYMDAFIVAFRIPNLLRDLLAEGALGSSFTKVYSSLCAESGDPEQVARDANTVLIQTLQIVTLISLCICGIGILFAPSIVDLMTSSTKMNSNSSMYSTTIGLTQLMFPFIGFASLGAVIQGALYQRGGYFLAGLAPIAFNGLSIAGALWFGLLSSSILPDSVIGYFGDAPIFGFALGTLLGGAAQAGFQLWGIWRPLLKGKDLWPRSFPWSNNIKKVFMLMGPMVIASSAGQVNVVVNTNFATSLETGAVTWLNFAFRLLQLPIGMFGVAVGAAVLPSLTKSITESKGIVDSKSSSIAVDAMELVLWLMVPCMFFMYGSAQDITRVLFQAGNFNAQDTISTGIAIQAYSLGLCGYGLLKVLNSYYYAVDRTTFPMLVSLFSIAANYAANSVLVNKYGHQGLAMTASIVLTLNAVVLLMGTSKDKLTIPWAQVGTSIALLLVASALVVVTKHLYSPYVDLISLGSLWAGMNPTLNLKLDSLLRLILDGIVIAIIFGGIGLWRLGKPPKEALRMLKRKRN